MKLFIKPLIHILNRNINSYFFFFFINHQLQRGLIFSLYKRELLGTSGVYSGTYYLCEKKKYVFIILRKDTIIFPSSVLNFRSSYQFIFISGALNFFP